MQLLKRVWEWVCKWKADNLAGEPHCVYLLDCWSVNLTEKLRLEVAAACPGMKLRFIPAGATGRFQVNDVHLHRPLKVHAGAAAQGWRLRNVLRFRKEHDATVASGGDAAASAETLNKQVHALMKIKVLRTKAADWLWTGCESLLKLIAGEGCNLI